MAEEILIKEGKEVIQHLKKEGIELSFAVWYTDPASQATYLALGAEEFDSAGPSDSYKSIIEKIDSIKSRLTLFKVDYLKLISLKSDLGKVFSSKFSNKAGDSMIGMFISPGFILHQIYAYGVAGS